MALAQGLFNEPDEEFYEWADKKLRIEIGYAGYRKEEIEDGSARRKYVELGRCIMDGPPMVAGVRVVYVAIVHSLIHSERRR